MQALLDSRVRRKGTPFAAQQAAVNCGQEAVKQGMKRVHIRVKGPGAGRESAIRAFSQSVWKSNRLKM